MAAPQGPGVILSRRSPQQVDLGPFSPHNLRPPPPQNTSYYTLHTILYTTSGTSYYAVHHTTRGGSVEFQGSQRLPPRAVKLIDFDTCQEPLGEVHAAVSVRFVAPYCLVPLSCVECTPYINGSKGVVGYQVVGPTGGSTNIGGLFCVSLQEPD